MITKDFYEEKAVKAKKDKNRIITMWVLAGMTLVALGVFYWIHFTIIIAIITGVSFIMLFRERNIEYEYSMANEDLQVDKIINQSRRRTAIQFNTSNIRMVAPADSYRLSNERERNPQMRFTDYTSDEPRDKVYGFYLDLRGISTVILLEPTENMMDQLRQRIPNAVYED